MIYFIFEAKQSDFGKIPTKNGSISLCPLFYNESHYLRIYLRLYFRLLPSLLNEGCNHNSDM